MDFPPPVLTQPAVTLDNYMLLVGYAGILRNGMNLPEGHLLHIPEDPYRMLMADARAAVVPSRMEWEDMPAPVGNLAAGLAPIMQALDNLQVIHNNLHAEMQVIHNNLHTEMQVIRNNLHADIQGVRNELQGVRNELQGVRNELQGVRTEVLESVGNLRVEMRKYAIHGIKAYNGPRGGVDDPFEIVPFPNGQLPEDLGVEETYDYIPLVSFAAIDSLNMAQARRYIQRYGVVDIPPRLSARRQLLARLIGPQGYRVQLRGSL